MKGKVNVIKESYKHYRFKNDRYKVSADYSEYSKIANAFFKNLFKKLVTTGFQIELPSRCGAFVIEQFNTEKYYNVLKEKGLKNWNRDVKSEKEFFLTYGYRKEITYDSDATDGKMWTFSWIKVKGGTFRNKHMYSFTLVRSNVRSTSNKSYSENSKRLTVHDFYKEEGYKIYRQLYRPYYNKYKNNLENPENK